MKRDLLYLFFFLITIQSGFSQTAKQLEDFKKNSVLFNSKYYKENVWDVFRMPTYPTANQKWRLYKFITAYDASTRNTIDWGTGRYLMFDLQTNGDSYTSYYEDDVFNSGNKFKVVLKLYEKNGTYVKTICSYGKFMGFGDKGFLFEQDDYYGTFFANDKYKTNDEITYTPTTGTLTKLSQLTDYNYSPQIIKPKPTALNFRYNGKEQGPDIEPNAGYDILGTLKATERGSYTILVKLKPNNVWIDGTNNDIEFEWSIEMGNYDMTNAKWNYTAPIPFDGTEKRIEVTGLPEGVTVESYMGNTGVYPGEYMASVILNYDKNNYYSPILGPITWEIAENYIVVTKPTITNSQFLYSGEEHKIQLSTMEQYFTVTGDMSATNAGSYSITVSLNDKQYLKWDDNSTDDVILAWSIEKADYNMATTTWDYVDPFVWDGTVKTVLLQGLPEGVSVESYSGNSATNPGNYTASATLNYDKTNFNEPSVAPLSWQIVTSYTNLSITKLWDNVLAVSNINKYEEIRNANFR